MLVGLNLKLCIGVLDDFEGGSTFLPAAKLTNELLGRNVEVKKEELFLGDFLKAPGNLLVDASLGPRTLKLLRESIQLVDNV